MTNLSIPRVQLTAQWWKQAKPDSIKSRSLDLALQRFQKAESDQAKMADSSALERLAEAIEELAHAAKEVSGECDRRSDQPLLKALKELEDQAAKRRRDLEARLKELLEKEGEDAPVAEADLLDVDMLRRLMKILPKRPMPFAFGVGDGGATYMVMDKTRKGGSLMAKLKELSGCSSATFGIASVEGKELCLDTHGPKLAGLGKKTREFLRENKPMPFTHVRVQGESADEEGEDDQGKESGGTKTKTKAKSKAEPEVEPGPEAEAKKGKAAQPAKEPEIAPTPDPKKDDPPLNMITPLMLSGSVGAGGKNNPQDVENVQAYLNRNGAGIGVDGKCGPQTIAAIKVFQKKNGFQYPDGRVDPGGKTEAALNGQKVEFPKQQGGGGYGKQQGGGGYGKQQGGGGYGGGAKQKIPHEVQSSDPTYVKKSPGPEYIHRKAGTVKETSPVGDAVEYAKKVAKAVATAQKKAGEKVVDVVKQLAEAQAEAQRTKAREDAERARQLKEMVESAYDAGKKQVESIKKAAEDLVRDKTENARKALEEAAKAVGKGFKDVDVRMQEGIDWLKSE